jgi:hypothetical protein
MRHVSRWRACSSTPSPAAVRYLRVVLANAESRSPRWLVAVFTTAGLLLIPWTAAVGIVLPAEHVAQHWDIAWTGFDVMLTASLLATGFAVARRTVWLQGIAAVSGALLLCDAWFDTLTASPDEVWIAALLAAGEVSLALLCFALATNATRRLRNR